MTDEEERLLEAEQRRLEEERQRREAEELESFRHRRAWWDLHQGRVGGSQRPPEETPAASPDAQSPPTVEDDRSQA